MIVATIATLKASLSERLAGVKAGEQVVVTDRGCPVARPFRRGSGPGHCPPMPGGGCCKLSWSNAKAAGEVGRVRFWDSSALLPLFVFEPRSHEVKALAEAGPQMAVWWATPVECASIVHRPRREGTFSAGEAALLEGFSVLPAPA